MPKYSFEKVYDSMQGGLLEAYRLPEVEDAFAEGGFCMEQYGQMWEAYERLLARTGQTDEDPDVEDMIFALFQIQKELCRRMYYYGAQFGGN